MDGKFGEIENKLVTVEEFQNMFLEIERKFATLSLEKEEQQMAAVKANGWSLAEKATALTLALRGDAPTPQTYYRRFLLKNKRITINCDGLLKQQEQEKADGIEERKQLIVPRNRVSEIRVSAVSEGSTGGHFGVSKTLGKVRELFYWLNCTTYVKDWCKKCAVCAPLGLKGHTLLHMPLVKRMVKRMNRTINRYLSKVVSNHQNDWDQFFHLFLLAFRTSVHETTGQTPASIVMGRDVRLPCELKFGCTPDDDMAGEDYVCTLRQRMNDIHEQVRSRIQGASERMKKTYDINFNDGRYQPGNQVWLYNPQRRRGLSPKLQSSWEGPYQVVTQINNVVYRIQN
ncbi:hypothetical protein NQ318_012360 [Aromia moschata]|uniref:RNA-directed DNA polymerase n=1 Tax=Aromia moschata TaxID=1265417 RepID=A0AAV8XJT8_9CUCU|nr:hypothetical protein NQ318_012360 [Aromia moschata]